MSRSDNYTRQNGRSTGSPTDVDLSELIDQSELSSISHYDFILTVIPLAFAIGYLGSNLGGLSLEGGMAIAAVVGGLAVLDALFVHAPAGSEE